MAASERPHILVLAAGRGTRMGGPKALMDVGGRPWCQCQAQRLDDIAFPVTWVISAEVARDPRSAGLGRTVRADSAAPMFHSLRAGCASLTPSDLSRGLFVLPVDVPVPSRPVWLQLAGSPSPAVPAHRSRRGHPVFLPAQWLADHPLPAAGRLDELLRDDLREVAVADPDVCVNLNTPADVTAWLGAARGATTT